MLEDGLRLGAALDLAVGYPGNEILENLVHAVVVLQLPPDPHGFAERDVDLFFHFAVEVRADFLLLNLDLLLASFRRKRIDPGDDVPDGGVSGLERLQYLVFGDLLRPRLDHHDRVTAASHDQIQPAATPLFEGGVDHEAAVHHAHANARGRAAERQAREGKGRGRAGDRQYIRIVLGVG